MHPITHVVFYHANCADGFASAVSYHLLSEFSGETEYLTYQYEDDLDMNYLWDMNVFFLDCSISEQALEAVSAVATHVTIIDHHKTAEPLLNVSIDNFTFVYSTEHSGAYATWLHFNDDNFVPFAIRLISDRDMWRFQIAGSKEFHIGIMNIDRNLDLWGRIFLSEDDTFKIIDDGEILLLAHSKACEVIARNFSSGTVVTKKEGFPAHFYSAVFINCNFQFVSDVSEILYRMQPLTDHLIVAFSVQGSKVHYSLRAGEDFQGDCSVIAKYFGGGGHAKASGFAMPLRLSHLVASVSGNELFMDRGDY